MNKHRQKKIALVHDFLVSYGGAERVFQVMAEMFPDAPIYTLLADQEIVTRYFPGREVRVSWLCRLPKFLKKRYRFFLPFFPAAVEAFDLRDFDLVLSSSGAWGKGIVTRLDTTHIAYLHSPMRYAWDYHEQYLAEIASRSGKKKPGIFTRLLLSYMRLWDRQAAERPDILLANSQYTQARIEKYYRRKSTVLYPPVTLSRSFSAFAKEVSRGDYFLLVSRLTRSKKVDVAIEAFNKLGISLVIVGSGREENCLREQARKNITFMGFVDDEKLATLYAGARALIFPSEEDFGMTAVEALSFGTPVIAFDYGGVREIVEIGKTGETFHAQTPEVLAEGVRRFLQREGTYDESMMKQSAKRFSQERFQTELGKLIQEF
ncbi:MAG: glycosyltransferase [Candidatus Moranbacteria bacterium]|nr:glycosyltransferase [Candidatus Moranbacteria bacterium]